MAMSAVRSVRVVAQRGLSLSAASRQVTRPCFVECRSERIDSYTDVLCLAGLVLCVVCVDVCFCVCVRCFAVEPRAAPTRPLTRSHPIPHTVRAGLARLQSSQSLRRMPLAWRTSTVLTSKGAWTARSACVLGVAPHTRAKRKLCGTPVLTGRDRLWHSRVCGNGWRGWRMASLPSLCVACARLCNVHAR
jgi:hypothetical protein